MGLRWWDESANSSGGLVTTTTMPTTTDIPNPGDVALVISGVLKGLMFINDSGTVKFITQMEPPRRATAMSMADADTIAVAITAGTGGVTASDAYFYELTQADGTTPAGEVEIRAISNGSAIPAAIGLQIHTAS